MRPVRRRRNASSSRYAPMPSMRCMAMPWDAIAGDYAIVRVDGWPMRALALHCEVYAIAKNADAGTIVARLSHDRRVESAQILQHFHTLTAATSYRPLQYALDR